jgi:hypothetical protein
MRSGLLIGAFACLCGTAMAAEPTTRVFLDGNDLLARCSGAGFDSGVCEGYVMAVADAMSGDNSVLGLRACIDVQVKGTQVREVVVAALRRGPANWHLTARGLAAKAIAEAFPCH